ncbi:diphthine--ammonia ligase [Rubrolithibacter danxiaensis]|uniref:Dph6-related ATP pyrophosphatase n=1 Tax=Rubrolithibacter danxiaensis TaxID=3390805 RepID=UPI003BF78311
MKKNAALFWSGGKDSAFALYLVQKHYPEIRVACLVTTLSEEYKRISMHGIREYLLDKQAEETGLPLYKMYVPAGSSNQLYEKELNKMLLRLKAEGIEFVIFGDIFLEDLKQYREDLLKQKGLSAIFPLWKRDTRQYLADFLASGFKTIICCTSNLYLDDSWLGRELNERFLLDLPEGIDPCGENGEFHTFCFDGPVFKKPVNFKTGNKEYRQLSLDRDKKAGFWYLDLY